MKYLKMNCKKSVEEYELDCSLPCNLVQKAKKKDLNTCAVDRQKGRDNDGKLAMLRGLVALFQSLSSGMPLYLYYTKTLGASFA